MIVIPAIDLRGGKAVRLTKGDFNQEKVYSDNPAEIARGFAADGARRIHIVDLEGALGGEPKHAALIRSIASEVKSAEFEVGGGVREARTVDMYLRAGVSRVVVGTRACLDRGFLAELLAEFGEKVIIGVDAVKGMVATDGWTKVTGTKAEDLIDAALAAGGSEIIHTDIDTDGMLKGPNTAELGRLAGLFPTGQFIASGGVSSLDDLDALKKLGKPNIFGAIIGKAIYEGNISVREAVVHVRNTNAT